MKKIDAKTANSYIANFASSMKKAGMDKPEKGFPQCVVFKRKELQEWLNNLGPESEQIKIYFAAYPKAGMESASMRTESGRITTILWPCDGNGEPANDKEGKREFAVNYGDPIP